MPETAIRTPDQIQFIKKYLAALKNWQPNQLSVVIDGKITSYQRIIADLQQFVRSLPEAYRYRLAALPANSPQQLDLLESVIDEVSGSAVSPEAARLTAANIPPNLNELTQIYQSAIEAKTKRENLPQSQISEYIKQQITPIIIQTGVIRQAAKVRFELVIDNSEYLENLAAALGRKPEVVKRLAKIRLGQIIDKTITTQALTQARSISPDTSQLTALFVKNLQKELDFDDLLGTTVRTNKKDAKSAFESIKKIVAQETETAKPAIEAAAENLKKHPTVTAAAESQLAAAINQVETISLNRPPNQQLKPAAHLRLSQQLTKHQDNPQVQQKIISRALRIPAAQAKLIRDSLDPFISRLAASTPKLNPLLAADPDSIAADALRRPRLFPKPFVDAIKSGKITDAEIATIFQTARLLDIPPNAVILSRFGINAQNLTANLQAGKKWLGIIPMGHGLDPQDSSVVKLFHLTDAQQQLIKSLKSPPPLLPEHTAKQFLTVSRAAARRNRFSEFLDQINLFRLPRAISFNIGRIPPLRSIGTAASSFVSGLRVQSGPINSFFNFISSAGNFVRQTPSFLAAPFRAVGSAISNTIINPVKTWAGTQIKSGLAKAGAWLAKKGVTAAAKKVGAALIGKGTAALLAQAAPVVGQIAGALALLSTIGDIGKFLWQNRKAIGMGLAGMFFLGQMLLAKLLGVLGTAAWTLGGALTGGIIGFAVGGPLGAAVGSLVGGAVGYFIGSGGLGAVISGIGAWLGNAAASLSSFIGSLTAPSLTAGLGTAVASVGIGGLIISWTIATFFVPNIQKSALLAPDETLSPSDSGSIGKITLSCADISNAFVYQSDPAWANVPCPDYQVANCSASYPSCRIGPSGCGSASITALLKSFGSATEVTAVWDKQHKIGGYQYSDEGGLCSTVHGPALSILTGSGLSASYIGSGDNEDWQETTTILENCGLIYASGQAHWPSGSISGHVLVITGVITDGDGKVTAIKTLDSGTIDGNGLVRPLGNAGDYAFELSHMWGVVP